MNIHTIDAHTHVNMMETAQQGAVIQRALDKEIGIINAGADEVSSLRAVELARAYTQGVWATVGYHPHEALKKLDIDLLKNLARDERVVGIGECGLDYFNLDKENGSETKRKQKELFELHISLVHELKKPLVIHCREAFPDVIEILEKHKDILLPEAGILHFFTGTIEDARALLKLGFSFTFGGLVTFNRSFDEILTSIPLERILAETDAPWVAPKSYRGKQNEPSYIPEVVEWLAKIKNVPEEEMGGILLENTKRVFKLDF